MVANKAFGMASTVELIGMSSGMVCPLTSIPAQYHSGIYFHDTSFSRNPVECLVAKFSRLLYFMGYIMRENIYHAVIYHCVSMV